MITYIIEFAILHLLFFVTYKLLLAKETQLSFLRLFLVGSTILSLVLPAIKIPTRTSIPTIDMEAVILPMFTTSQPEQAEATPWYLYILGLVCVAFCLRLIIALVQIYQWYRESETSLWQGVAIRKVAGLQNSFTFFKWIFIDPEHFENPSDIIRHELGHAKKLHSLDMLLFHILTIVCWWMPTVWLTIKELKAVHEFEADAYALKTNTDTYAKTLVLCTLKAHGMSLASSFDDAPIFNRLNFMKKMKKKISIWKVASITALVAISGALFACEDEVQSEIKRIAAESNQQIQYSSEVETALAQLKEEYPDQQFSIVETKIENEESLKMLQKHDPSQIQRIFVNKEDGQKNVVIIVNQNSDLFQKTIDAQQKDLADEVFTITETAASFPGGIDAFNAYMDANLEYPKDAYEAKNEGRVFVQFIVEKDGSLSDVHIVKGIGGSCDEEAVRVLKESPKWIPGKVHGQNVRQKMIQNILFKLPD